MKNFSIFSALLLLAGTVFGADWAAPQAGDLHIESLPESAAVALPSRHTEARPVRYAWPLVIDQDADAPAGPSTESRAYWVDATGRSLARGLKLPLSAPGAIVRVSALHAGTGVLLDADKLEVGVDGNALAAVRGGEGLKLISGSELQAQGMAVPADTLAFKLPDGGEPRTLHLALAGAPAGQAFVVHVFEPESRWRGELSASRHNYLAGGEIHLEVGLASDDQRFAAESVQAVLVSPDAAHAWPLTLADDGRGLSGAAPRRLPDAGEGLYEVHAWLQGRQGDALIRRDLKVAIGIAAPTARLGERITTRFDGGLDIDLSVEVAAAGRYQASAQIWGTDARGRLQPLAMAEAAAVLEAGHQALTLEVPPELILQSGLDAPFEARQVRLLDQGRMALLESRSRGFSIDRLPPQPGRPFDSLQQ